VHETLTTGVNWYEAMSVIINADIKVTLSQRNTAAYSTEKITSHIGRRVYKKYYQEVQLLL